MTATTTWGWTPGRAHTSTCRGGSTAMTATTTWGWTLATRPPTAPEEGVPRWPPPPPGAEPGHHGHDPAAPAQLVRAGSWAVRRSARVGPRQGGRSCHHHIRGADGANPAERQMSPPVPSPALPGAGPAPGAPCTLT